MLEMGDAATDNEERREEGERFADGISGNHRIMQHPLRPSVRSPPSAVAIIAFAVKRRFAACDFT